jgi:hypothetical protein
MQLSDGRDLSARINDAHLISSFSATPCLASVGPSPVMSSSRIAFPLLPCVIVPPSLTRPYGLFLVSSSIYHLPRVPFPPCQPLTKLHLPRLFSRLSAYIPYDLCHPLPPLSPLIVLTSPLRLWPHHSVAVPHFPRWPPYPSFKLFSYSRWQREESSISQNAELA